MSVVCLVAGGLERADGGINGIRTVIGDNGLDSPLGTTVNAPLAGLRGVRSHAGQVGGACYIPAQTTGADCPAFAANGRSWLAVHSEVIPDNAFAITGNATYSLFKLYMPDFISGSHRDLQLLFNAVTEFLNALDLGVTYTATSLCDTTKNFTTAGVLVGDYVVSFEGYGMIVTSITTTTNPNDTLNGTGGWSGHVTPTDHANSYAVCHPSGCTYKWRITDGTTNWDSSARPCLINNTTSVLVIDFRWQPGLTAGTNTMQLWVNGVREINQTGGTVVPAPASVLSCVAWIGSDDVAKGNAWQDYVQWYNTIFYDDVSQTPFDTFPIAYDPLVTNRPLVTYRPPKLLGSHKYTAWSPSTGTDVSAVIDDHPTISQTDYIISAVSGDMESWQCVDLTACDYPLTTADQIYAVESIGNCSIGLGDIIEMGHTDGSTLDDVGRHVRGNVGVGQMLWCASKDPGGQPWTYATANTCQTWVRATGGVGGDRVFDAGQLILFRKNAAGEVAVTSTANPGTATDAQVT